MLHAIAPILPVFIDILLVFCTDSTCICDNNISCICTADGTNTIGIRGGGSSHFATTTL